MKEDKEDIRHKNTMEEIEEQKKLEELRHKNTMEELKQDRDYKLEALRIKSAEIKRSQERNNWKY